MHGDLFLSKTAAAIHTLGFQKGSSSARLLFLKLAVHRTALKRGALFCSSPSTLLNENFFTSCALVERRQLGSLEEHILEHSLSTSFRKCCCRCFRSMGFFHAAVASGHTCHDITSFQSFPILRAACLLLPCLANEPLLVQQFYFHLDLVHV